MDIFYSERNAIIKNYYTQTGSIIEYEVAMEAAIEDQAEHPTSARKNPSGGSVTSPQKDNQLKSGNVDSSTKTTVLQKIAFIIKKMQAWLTEFATRMKNYAKRIWQSDSAFEKQYAQIKKQRNPMQGVKVIKYEYDNHILDQLMNRVINMVKKIYTDAKSPSAITNPDFCLIKGKRETEQYIIMSVGNDLKHEGDMDNIQVLFNAMKRTYRKEKKEVLVTASQIGLYEEGLHEAKKAMDKVNQTINQMRTMSSDLDQYTKSKVNDVNSAENVGKYQKIMSNFSTVYSFFINFSHYFYDLKTEYQFCCREVLKKLYQF